MPKKLRAYRHLFVTVMSRARYSIVKRIVMIHSRTSSRAPYRASSSSTVSSMTSSTLNAMSTSKLMSNARDSGVWWSKMMWRMRSRHPVLVACTRAA